MIFYYCTNSNMGRVATLVPCFIKVYCDIPVEIWIHFLVGGFHSRSRLCIELVYALCLRFPEFLQVLLKSLMIQAMMGHVHRCPKVVEGCLSLPYLFCCHNGSYIHIKGH